MGARDFPCHGDSATARPDSARSLPRKPEVRGNHRCRGRGAIFEIGRRAAREVSVFLWELVQIQSPHRQGPFAQHVAGHGAFRFAPAKGAFRFALATPGFCGGEVDRREHVRSKVRTWPVSRMAARRDCACEKTPRPISPMSHLIRAIVVATRGFYLCGLAKISRPFSCQLRDSQTDLATR